MKKYLLFLLILCLAASSNAFPVKKDTKIILDELQKLAKRLDDLELKVKTISEDTSNALKKINVITDKVNAISRDQADSTQRKENVLLSLQFLKEEINELKNSINKIGDRIQNLPSRSISSTSDDLGGSEENRVVQSPESIYYTAYSDYIKKNYDLAIQGFRQFIKLYPQNGLADNSLYWIGECYYSQKKFQEAVNTFNELKRNYQDGDKIPDSILKEGFALIEMGKQTEGIDVLKELVSKYPLSEEASLAQQKIKEVME